jgi:hypothetical protein
MSLLTPFCGNPLNQWSSATVEYATNVPISPYLGGIPSRPKRIGPRRVSSTNPSVVEASSELELVLFFKLYFGLKNKIKNAPTNSIVIIRRSMFI